MLVIKNRYFEVLCYVTLMLSSADLCIHEDMCKPHQSRLMWKEVRITRSIDATKRVDVQTLIPCGFERPPSESTSATQIAARQCASRPCRA
jgi:hypothetical protein